MSTDVLNPNAEQRNIQTDRNWLPRFGRVFRSEAAPTPSRPRPAAIVPQDIDTARAALVTLQTAGAAVRARIAEDPNLSRGEECFSDAGAKRIQGRWASDLATAMQEAAAGQELSILKTGDVARMNAALNGIPLDTPGAIERQRKIVADLEQHAAQTRFAKVHAPNLRAADVKVANALLALRDAWQARVTLAEEARADGAPVVLPTPAIPRMSDQLRVIIKQIGNTRTPEELL
jgi:hypothetical protein